MLPAWARLVWHSLGAAAVTAAAQLGLAQAFGVIGWTDSFGAGNDNGWTALLTWIGFSFAVAVLSGATVGRRAIRRPSRRDGFGARAVATLAATVGAFAAVALAWVPARDVRPPVNVNPELVVAMTAGAGIIVGALTALLALSLPPVAGGVRATIAWVWTAAIGSAAVGIASGEPYEAPRLGVVDAPAVIGPERWWSGPNLMIGMAALLGLTVAAIARWVGGNRFGIALSGLAGPILVAAAYIVAGPGVGDGGIDQGGPYRASLIATGAGLCASVLVALVGRRPDRSDRRSGRTPANAATAAGDDGRPLFGEIVQPEPAEPVMGQPGYGHDDGGFRSWLDDIGPAAPGRHKTPSR